MKESTLAKITASVAAARGIAQKALATDPNPAWTEYEMRSIDEWISLQDVKLDRPEAIRSRAEGEGEMTGTPRRPWTPERDKELRALVLSANSVDTIAKALNRTTFAVRRRANTLRLPLRKIARIRRLI